MTAVDNNGPARSGAARGLRWPLMVGVPVVIVVAAAALYLKGGRIQETDDAYINASRVAISSNIAGRVIEVAVRENQFVHKGDLLFRLDSRDQQAAVDAARAQLAQARLQVRSTQSGYAPRASELDAAVADLAYREKELARQRALTDADVGSRRELDERINDVSVARRRVETAKANAAQALAAVGQAPGAPVDEHPSVQAAKVALDRALLNLGYTTMAAPQDGVVTRVEQLQVGSYINPAQPLFALVAPRMWVDANFKEDQLAHMRVGQTGEVRVDAFPGRSYPVHVESLSPGTGAAFAVLPAENATGNWVKVTQRLPVRIAFDRPDEVKSLLHAGLSARVRIDTQHRRTLFGAQAAVPGRP